MKSTTSLFRLVNMLLDKIEKLTEAQNLIMDSLKIRSGYEGLTLVAHSDASPCLHCSSFEYVESDCPMMAIQGPYPYQKNLTTYWASNQAGRSHYLSQGYHNNSYYTHFMRSSRAGSTLHTINPLDLLSSLWGTQGRHLSPLVLPWRLHHH